LRNGCTGCRFFSFICTDYFPAVLSILIPIYNYDVQKLVAELSEQCVKAEVDFEILCYDDASFPGIAEANKGITAFEGVEYTILRQNIGRSAIRNLLAKNAKYDHLLFIDCDMQIEHRDYIDRYLSCIGMAGAIFGGLNYGERPKDTAKQLRWVYGMEREAVSAKERGNKPYISLKTCNLLISKELFRKVMFNETLRGYGYEDTLFGIELQRAEADVLHIDNSLIHKGLENSDVFLEKTIEAMKNLKRLLKDPEIKPYLSDMRIVKYYHLERRLGLEKLSLLNYQSFKPVILKNLKSKRPSLKLFDFYKLAQLIKA
jgi:glycosyltransferase involved in cell wall biosynthesis